MNELKFTQVEILSFFILKTAYVSSWYIVENSDFYPKLWNYFSDFGISAIMCLVKHQTATNSTNSTEWRNIHSINPSLTQYTFWLVPFMTRTSRSVQNVFIVNIIYFILQTGISLNLPCPGWYFWDFFCLSIIVPCFYAPLFL